MQKWILLYFWTKQLFTNELNYVDVNLWNRLKILVIELYLFKLFSTTPSSDPTFHIASMLSTDTAIAVCQFSIVTIFQGQAQFFLGLEGEPSAIRNLKSNIWAIWFNWPNAFQLELTSQWNSRKMIKIPLNFEIFRMGNIEITQILHR